ncbi:anthranilate synthase component I family protein [Psychroflexus maritimus]|uniref:Anthranilate synthase component I family protein n=1 Tax=Psychroflexus maritimus TaxID=2714865 RepID=A0A967DY63_9FLAO|nr:anthranilate synthase component I family protein [Psychroflexus maritimus]NGZ88773.1 anthranilate synthase component I family protein [Psychroflexus maritimus]
MRKQAKFELKQVLKFKENLLHWANQDEYCVFLDSNLQKDTYTTADSIVGIGAFTALKVKEGNAFKQLEEYQKFSNDWLFGYFSYDLKNEIENLQSNNQDEVNFPNLYFVQPIKVIELKGNTVTFHYLTSVEEEIESDFRVILDYQIPALQPSKPIQLTPRISRSGYIESVKKTLAHIARGDIYEANFCMDFYATNVVLNPLHTYLKLNAISSPPQAAYLKFEHYSALCASPERYLKHHQQKLISQPIKGTAKRGQTKKEDLALKKALENDPKEKSENIMIVDLVRNDLSKTAQKASVKVEELCKVYSFKQVHQLISTVTSQPKTTFSPVSLIQSTFPMGSMTGAPKVSAMQLMEKLESFRRGLYSGSIGYFTPNGNFDFNVVIRSILYNSANQNISYAVGSAITSASIPEKEYQECLIKAKAMKEVLS